VVSVAHIGVILVGISRTSPTNIYLAQRGYISGASTPLMT